MNNSLHISIAEAPSPTVEYVHQLLQLAVAEHASDIHFEPDEDRLNIRYRIDGMLQEASAPPKQLAPALLSRLKVMANLDIAEKQQPQDGRFRIFVEDRSIEFRLSTLPTQHGESIVLRVLDQAHARLNLNQLGFSKNIYECLTSILEKNNGIFIATGPTGAGKTTTLYACLHYINDAGLKILTVEDPIEYEIEGAQQVAVQDNIDLNFPRVLRSFLRHDPDCLLVGEIRDTETAKIAVQASLTGHLVLSSLHTNDASGAIFRLIDMGIEPFFISAALEAVLAQRLVRKLCEACKTDKKATGCSECRNTGYKGRCGIYELMPLDDELRFLIDEQAPLFRIQQKAVELGMIPLKESALKLARSGVTSFEEIEKYFS
ncbi:MAG: GspE/PulE family protein [Verrucomicrobiota bacterium]